MEDVAFVGVVRTSSVLEDDNDNDFPQRFSLRNWAERLHIRHNRREQTSLRWPIISVLDVGFRRLLPSFDRLRRRCHLSEQVREAT